MIHNTSQEMELKCWTDCLQANLSGGCPLEWKFGRTAMMDEAHVKCLMWCFRMGSWFSQYGMCTTRSTNGPETVLRKMKEGRCISTRYSPGS